MIKLLNVPNITRVLILGIVALFLLTMCSFGNCAFNASLESSLVTVGPKLVVVGFLFIFIKLVTSSIKLLLEKKAGKKESSLFTILNLVRYAVWVLFIIISASIFFGDVGALMTSLGLIGFGITFALQKPILNSVGWFNIKYHKTFQVGDRIKIRDYRGDVIEVKMMHTIIKSLLEGTDQLSGKIVSIPNEVVLTEPVENYTKDNNFVKSEIKISVTYESDWKKAKSILEQIVMDVTKKNLHQFKTNITRKISLIDSTIEKLSLRIEKTQKKERGTKIKDKITVLEEEKKMLTESMEEIPAQFYPKSYMEMADSAIILSSVFVTPFDMSRKIMTEINTAFLNAVKKERNIEIAYPHMKLVLDTRPQSKNIVNLAEFLGIETIEPNLTSKKEQS